MTVANTIALQFVGDADQLKKEMAEAAASINKTFKANQNLGQALGNLKNKIAGISAPNAILIGSFVAAGTAIAKVISTAAAYGNELQKVSNRTGETVETLSRLKFAAEQEDVSLQEVTGSLRIVSRQADAAAKGNDKAAAAFERLGVEVKDSNGNLKSGTVLLREIGEGLAKIPPGTARTAAGMAVLGRSAQSIIPLVTNLKELDARAEQLGLTVSSKFGRDADEFGDRMDEIRAITNRAGVAIAEALLPVMNDFLEALTNDLIPALKAFRDFMGDVGFVIFQAQNRLAAFDAELQLFLGNLRSGKTAGQAFAFSLGLMPKFGQENAQRIQELRDQLQKAQAQAKLTREEFEKLGADEPRKAPNPEEILSAAEALQQLVQGLTETEQAIAPVVQLAESLAGVFPELNPRFQELVSGLRGIQNTGPEAAAALREVLAVAARAKEALAGELAEGFRAATETPRSITPRRREVGVEGPLTQEQALGLEGPLGASGGIETETLQKAPEIMLETATMAEKIEAALLAADLAAEGMNTTLAEGQGLIAGFTNLADGFAEAFVQAAEGGKLAFQDFFKALLRDLAKAIIRATILQAILGFFGGGFSLGKILKNVQQALGFGPLGFAHQESSLLGRASQARSLGAVAGPSLAGGGTENVQAVNRTPEIRVYEPGPFTMVEMTDRGVIPRLRERQRQLNEEAF